MKRLLGWMVAALLPLFSGCETPLPNTESSQGQQTGPVKIGFIAPQSGENAVFGKQMLRGAEIAVDEINCGRGVNDRPVELVVIDNAVESDPVGKAASEGAVVFIAGYGTTDVSALIDPAGARGMPAVIPLATEDGHVGANPFIFRNAYTNTQQSEALAGYLWYWRQLLRIGIMVDMQPEAEYERSIGRAVAQSFRDLGGRQVSMAEYHGDDFEDAVGKILADNPQAIVVPAPGKRSARIIRALREHGFRGIICGPDSWDDTELLAGVEGYDKIGDCVFISFFTEENPSEEARAFRKSFMERFDYEPGACETQTYDAVKMLAIAMNGVTTIEGFTANWLLFRNYFGAAAIYTMLPGGDLDRTIYVSTIVTKKTPYPVFRLLHRFQYSKLETYRND